MRCLNESIARRANREDGCTGRFWEGRFRSQALLDEGAVLTCMSYVDLNPIRAGIAKTLEGGEFTSIRERLRAVTTRSKVASRRAPQLLPFDGDEPREQGHSFECLPMRLTDYVALLELTGRSIREERSGEEELSPELEAALRRVGLEPSGFIPGVREFGRTFFGMVGRMHRIEVESARRGYVRRMGMRAAQRLYRPNAA